ncbi:MAG: heavy metal-binding domain-containing protein, partial [Actinobacteria bacterium]|nr:heavy metal-binding domain-containing protein [Actinomycetota bacterium]
VGEFAAISQVGFEPVGQVLGAAVYNVGYAGDEECPYGLAFLPGEGSRLVPRQAPTGAAAIGSARPLVSVLYQARRAAIRRMTAECTALGALGVIGVRLEIGPFGDDEDILEFRALGTAIHAPGVVSRAQPFASDLSGQDFTKLVAHGWMPVGLALGIAVGYRHDDWLTRGQTRFTAGNVEVDGYSYLVRQMRTDARNELELDLVRMGAEGVVVREMQTRISERKCPIVPLGHDHVAEATIVGTAIVQFASFAPPPVYGIRKLDGRRPVPPPQQWQVSVSLGDEPADDQSSGADGETAATPEN